MKRVLYWAAVACVPFGIPAAIGLWAIRRYKAKNAIVQVKREHGPLRVVPKADA